MTRIIEYIQKIDPQSPYTIGIIAGIILLMIILFGKSSQRKKGKKRRSKGVEYEYKVARYLRRHGFHNVRVTKASGDYGVDIVARKGLLQKYAIQCKYYSDPVGISAVQQVVAGKVMYRCPFAMVITNSTYTKAAIRLAEENGVILESHFLP